MENSYKREMERLGPRQEELERLYTMIEEGTIMNRKKKIGFRAAVALACAALMTIAAAAAAPTVWDILTGHLGVFAPYAQTIEGTVCRDQGLEVKVLSALSDDLWARVYFSVRDVEEDRLDECLSLTGQIQTEARKDSQSPLETFGNRYFKLLSYDPETKTALMSASIYYYDIVQPARDVQLTIEGMSTRKGYAGWDAPCADVTGQLLDSQVVEGEVILEAKEVSKASDYPLMKQVQVLAPEQNPVPLAGTEDMWISSMGFASDGCFHVRLGFAEGVEVRNDDGFFGDLFLPEGNDDLMDLCQETLVEGGMDILFPQVHPENLELIRTCMFRCYGYYARSGAEIEGDWSASFRMDYHPSVTLDWTGDVLASHVSKVTLSPLSVTMYSNARGGMSGPLYATKEDGSVVTVEPGAGRHGNLEASGKGEGWSAFNTWTFQEPVDPEEIVSLQLGDTVIPVR